MPEIIFALQQNPFTSLWPSDAIWWPRSGSTLPQVPVVIAFCLMAPSHYLNQCWLLISEVLKHSLDSNFIGGAEATILCYEFENYTFNITATSPRGHWVKETGKSWPKTQNLPHSVDTVFTSSVYFTPHIWETTSHSRWLWEVAL